MLTHPHDKLWKYGNIRKIGFSENKLVAAQLLYFIVSNLTASDGKMTRFLSERIGNHTYKSPFNYRQEARISG